MAEAEKNEILLAIENLGSKIQVQTGEILEMQKQISQLQTEVGKISERQRQISRLQIEVERIPEMQEDIRKISKSAAVIELEHGEKLDLLFDIFDMQQEKLRSHERRIQLCERHLDRHDDEIYYLKEIQRA